MSRQAQIIVVAAITAIVGMTAGWLTWGRSKTAIDPNDPAQVARGQAVYQGHCASCHGADLKGEADWQTRRPSGELPAPPHDETGHTWHHPDEQLFAIVKHGMARFAPPDYKTSMEAYVGRLTDADIRAVLAYIKAQWPAQIRARQEAMNKR